MTTNCTSQGEVCRLTHLCLFISVTVKHQNSQTHQKFTKGSLFELFKYSKASKQHPFATPGFKNSARSSRSKPSKQNSIKFTNNTHQTKIPLQRPPSKSTLFPVRDSHFQSQKRLRLLRSGPEDRIGRIATHLLGFKKGVGKVGRNLFFLWLLSGLNGF